jgi:mycoredoxin
MTENRKIKWQRPKLLHFVLAVVLALLIVDRAAAWLHLPDADSKAVVVYTTEWCPYCQSLQMYLNAYRIPYKNYDVEQSLSGMLGFWALRAKGIPVSVIGPEVIYGYDMEKIGKALNKLGYKVEAGLEESECTRQIPEVLEQVMINPPQGRLAGSNATLQFTVTKDGQVSRFEVLNSSPESFGAEAIRVIRKWKFLPACKDGSPVDYSGFRQKIVIKPQ